MKYEVRLVCNGPEWYLVVDADNAFDAMSEATDYADAYWGGGIWTATGWRVLV